LASGVDVSVDCDPQGVSTLGYTISIILASPVVSHEEIGFH